MREISIEEIMPREQFEFIDTIATYIQESTNYGSGRAYQLGFEVWQNRKWLTEFLCKQKGMEKSKRYLEEIEQAETEEEVRLYEESLDKENKE